MATGPMSFDHFKAQLMPQLDQIVWERGMEMMRDEEFSWMFDLYRAKPTNNLQHEYSNQQRKGLWTYGTENSPYPTSQWEDPTYNTVDMQIIRDGFEMTDIWFKYGNVPQIHRIPEFQEKMRDFMLSGFRTMNNRAGALLLDAFTGSLMLMPDGQPLIDNAHTHDGVSISYDNYITAKFSAGSLEAIWDLNSHVGLVDAHGEPLICKFDSLLISEDYARVAEVVVGNTVDPLATNNSINFWNKRIKNIIVCPYLNNSVQAGSQHFWFVFDSKRVSAELLIAEEIGLRPPTNTNPDVLDFKGRGIFELYFKSWQGFAGSDGTTAAL